MTGSETAEIEALAQALHSQGVGCHGRDSAERHTNDARRLSAAGWALVKAAELDRLQRHEGRFNQGVREVRATS